MKVKTQNKLMINRLKKRVVLNVPIKLILLDGKNRDRDTGVLWRWTALYELIFDQFQQVVSYDNVFLLQTSFGNCTFWNGKQL